MLEIAETNQPIFKWNWHHDNQGMSSGVCGGRFCGVNPDTPDTRHVQQQLRFWNWNWNWNSQRLLAVPWPIPIWQAVQLVVLELELEQLAMADVDALITNYHALLRQVLSADTEEEIDQAILVLPLLDDLFRECVLKLPVAKLVDELGPPLQVRSPPFLHSAPLTTRVPRIYTHVTTVCACRGSRGTHHPPARPLSRAATHHPASMHRPAPLVHL